MALTAMMSAHLWEMMSFFLAVCCWYLSVPRRWERISLAICVPVCVSRKRTANWHNYHLCESVCVFMSLLGHNTANVIKQVLYCSRFLISKAFAAAMCVMNPFLFPWTFLCAFVWDVQTCRTNIGSEMHFFITPLVKRGSRVLNHLRML